MRGRGQLTLFVALALPGFSGCGDGGGFVDAAPTPPRGSGTFSLEWTIVDANHQPLTCTQANATAVVLGFSDVATGALSSSRFACDLGLAVTGALFAATYNVDLKLVGDPGTVAVASSQMASIVANMTTQLTPVTFADPM